MLLQEHRAVRNCPVGIHFQHALLAGTGIAAAAGLTGYFLVLRAQVFTGDALSHVAFTGALAALALGYDLRLGLFAATIVVALLLGTLGSRGRTEAFLTYGGLGYYWHSPKWEYRYETSRGPQVIQEPAFTRVLPPYAPVFGGGVQRLVADRLIVRFDVQGMWIPPYPILAGRFAAGVSVPLGRLSR